MFAPPVPKPKAALAPRRDPQQTSHTNKPYVGKGANLDFRVAHPQTSAPVDFSKVSVYLTGSAKRLQAKLERGAVDDPLEHEADNVAERVMRPSAPALTMAAASPLVQAKPFAPHAVGFGVPDSVHRVLRASGQPLDTETRAFFEPRFARDFSSVRVHTDTSAAASARHVSALAYTAGTNIVFGAGSYAPRTYEGRRLIAHELAHVVQQTGAHSPGAEVAPVSLQRAPDPLAQEADRAASEMWNTLNDVNETGAEVEFTYYTSNGAMTLVSFKRTKAGQDAAPSLTLDQFSKESLGFKNGAAAGSVLVNFVGTAERYFKLGLRRDSRKWTVMSWGDEKSQGLPSTPPEGRSQPNSASVGWPVDIVSRVQTAVSKWVPVFKAYPGGTATLKLSAQFDDDRLDKLELKSQVNHGGKGPAFAPAAFATTSVLTNTLLAFTQGLGKRTIGFTLEGDASTGATRWRVTEASTDRGPPPALPDEAAVIVADYQRMHAEIIRRWREGVKDAGVHAAMFGAEQLAFWLIGGVVAKGLGTVFDLAAPRLIGFIRAGSKGGSRVGVEYLETMVARLPAAEKAEMQAIARKAETEGVEALGKAERQSLDRLLKKLESMIESPLATAEKDILRGRMGTRFNATKPGVGALFEGAKRSFAIHHRLPLEWSHRFPGVDVNAGKNLIALEPAVHDGVSAVWTRLRYSLPKDKVGGNAVSRIIDIVDKHFAQWYDVVPTSSGQKLAAEVATATGAALNELAVLVSKL